MNHRIRVLGIAPYEGMKTLMSSVVADYPQIDLTLFVGDMEQGLEIAGVISTVITMSSSPAAAPLKCYKKT